MHSITFAHPWMLLGLLLIPAMIAWWILRYRKQEAALQHSNIALFEGVRQSLRRRLRWLPYALRDGTALGDGLATAINRIKDSEAKSKVIILMTDGVNNQGSVDPQSAAEIAAMYGIRLYTIGVGSLGKAPYPFRDQFGRVHYQNIDVEIDEALMKQMSAATDEGRYFRATNKKALEEIFDQIDEMEKSKIDVTQYAQTKDEYAGWLWIAVLALLLEALVRWGWFKV